MRILVISNLYPPHAVGGYEEACRDTVEGLRSRGHRVEVLTSAYGVARPRSEQGIHRLLQLDTAFLNEQPFHSRSLVSLWQWNRRSAAALHRLLRRLRPDVVYVWNVLGLPMGLPTMAQRGGFPIVWMLQDIWMVDNMRRDPWVVAWNYRSRSATRRMAKASLRRCVDHFLPTRLPNFERTSAHYASTALATYYRQQGRRFRRERVIPNGIDRDTYSPIAREWEAGPRKLLFMGRLEAGKGAHTAIEALALLLHQRGPLTATLTLVGASYDRPYRKMLYDLIHDHGLDAAVTIHAAVPRAATAAIYAEHDILLFPSRWIEGFGLVVLEALARGLPVVGTALGGTADMVRDDVTGLVAPPEDAGALAMRVGDLLADPALARRLSEAGVEMVCRQFDRRHVNAQVEDYLHGVVAPGGPGSAPCS